MTLPKAMGRKMNRKSNPSSASNTNVGAKHAAKKRPQKLSKDRSEHVRDALNRDVNLLYNALENSTIVPPSIPRTDSVALLAQSMRDLGR